MGGPTPPITVPAAAEKRRPSRDFVHLIPMVLVAVGFLAIWDVVVRLHLFFPKEYSYLFPGPADVGAALVDLWNRAALIRSIVATLSRLAVGFLLSLVLGSILALLMVHFATFGKGIQPYVLGLQTFPSIAWVPLSIVWFGFSEASLLFVTIIGSLFAVTVSVADGVTVPATLPHLISSAKVGWSFAWRSLVGAEVIFATVGLGFQVEHASEAPNIAQVMAVMFVILVLGVLVDRVVFSRSQEWVNRRWGLSTAR